AALPHQGPWFHPRGLQGRPGARGHERAMDGGRDEHPVQVRVVAVRRPTFPGPGVQHLGERPPRVRWRSGGHHRARRTAHIRPMKRLLILAAIAATACTDSEPPLPPDVLPRETFKEMLVGAHLITATTRARATVGLVLEDLGPGPAFDSLY